MTINPTPRTEAEAYYAIADAPHQTRPELNKQHRAVTAEFARSLERDLSTLRKAAEAARVALDSLLCEAMNYDTYVKKFGFAQGCAESFAKQALASLRSELAKTTPATPETPVPRPD